LNAKIKRKAKKKFPSMQVKGMTSDQKSKPRYPKEAGEYVK
jgi:hypothetical protein